MAALEQVKNRRWIEEQLAKLDMVEWDRFTLGDWDGEQAVTVYGWLDREDEYKDFVLLILWPEGEGIYYTTSSDEWTHEIHSRLFDDDPDEHNDCRRVERTFDVPNAIELHQETDLEEFA